jgi:hypothetical protein
MPQPELVLPACIISSSVLFFICSLPEYMALHALYCHAAVLPAIIETWVSLFGNRLTYAEQFCRCENKFCYFTGNKDKKLTPLLPVTTLFRDHPSVGSELKLLT